MHSSMIFAIKPIGLLFQQLSQFWYDDGTKKTLAKVCLKLILGRANKTQSRNVKIGLLSCPSLYKAIRNIHPNGIVRLFEYDKRFEVFNDDFVHYDYKEAAVDADYMSEYEDYFDIIIADPPFLSEECIQAMSTLVNRMRRDGSDIILCSGDVVARWAEDFMGLNQCGFRPQHERNLANEFRSYANFKLDALV